MTARAKNLKRGKRAMVCFAGVATSYTSSVGDCSRLGLSKVDRVGVSSRRRGRLLFELGV